MEGNGKRIAAFRKEKGLTQAELGEKLNVSSQAVSKWENDLSEPDLETVKRMAALFGISTDELLSEEVAATAQTAAPQVIAGYCNECKKPLYLGEDYEIVTAEGGMQKVYCAECSARIKERNRLAAEQADRERKDAEARAYAAKEKEYKTKLRRTLIWPAIGGVALFILGIISGISNGNAGMSIAGGAILGVLCFTYVSQLFWDGAIMEIMEASVKTIQFPGLIFTWDLDGFIWVICMKILFAVLGFLFTAIAWLAITAFAILLSPFTFFFALHRVASDKEFQEMEI